MFDTKTRVYILNAAMRKAAENDNLKLARLKIKSLRSSRVLPIASTLFHGTVMMPLLSRNSRKK